jgi:adenylylsulfate kinase
LNLTGVNDPFEIPASPDLYINTHELNIGKSTKEIYSFIMQNILREKYVFNDYAHIAHA